ncbi:MAG TPA: hypothetical protein VE549_08060, partial [Myxococcaceae bacterium]|nr:hypothetical protein [Myxococcaceae bacterium]
DRVYRWDEGVVSLQPAADGHLLSVAPGPLPASGSADLGMSDTSAYEWELMASSRPLWREEKKEAPFTIDAALLEDFADIEARVNLLSLLASSGEPTLFGPSGWYFQTAAGPTVAVSRGTPRVPVSRGAPCSVRGFRFDPCDLTDGILDFPAITIHRSGGPFPLVLALPNAARPSFALLRDFRTSGPPVIRIDGSADGATWVQLGELFPPLREMGVPREASTYELLTTSNDPTYAVHAGYYRIELSPPAEPITHIRLLGDDAFVMREISFFE